MSNTLDETIKNDRGRALSWREKAIQPFWYGRSIEEVVAAAPSIDLLGTPVMTLDLSALDHNILEMANWCATAGVSLAPHGKTTMTPALWSKQLAAGAWAITVANEPQLRAARGLGLSRIVLANMLLGHESLTWLSSELDDDDGFEFYCWVDSVAAVALMDASLQAVRAKRRVRVLIEVGAAHARTGARSTSEAMEVAQAVLAAPTLELSGVSGYEALVVHGVGEEDIRTVDAFLGQMLTLHRALRDLYEVDEVILSAGGSRFFDRVASVLGVEVGMGRGRSTRIVLRSGSYVTHDDGLYRRTTPSRRGVGPIFTAAMHVWARVISMPEPGVAYLDAGRRDVPFDSGLPEVQHIRRSTAGGSAEVIPLKGHQVIALNDQHAHVETPEGSPLRVGDVVRLGISHPCTAFDKWSLIPVLDDASIASPRIVDLFRTYF